MDVASSLESGRPNDSGLVSDFTRDLGKPLKKFASLTPFMRLHVLFAFVITTICFLVWHYTETVADVSTHWWWIYAFFFFALTITVHTFISSEQYMKAVVSSVLVINLMLFISDGLTSSTGYPQWFLYPWLVSAMLMLALHHYVYGKITVLQLGFYEYFLVMVLFFLIWVDTQHIVAPAGERPFPWFFIPLFIFAIPLVIGHVRTSYQEYRVWVHVSITLIILNLMLFVIWGFEDSTFPWFIFVWLITGAVVSGIWWKYLRGPNEGILPQTVVETASPGFSSPYTPVETATYQERGLYNDEEGNQESYQVGEESDTPKHYEAI
eukprot:TRINITY_DN11689_c0_g1_i1.p1 TRINITY_DN11689_c0_g1~~TRINITY_DN11689_c0_g1_i1.p1  ORF type:complete len:323 (+),score=44.61 TRINITY_DN11689_c0_g1_i1:13-981(+)